MATLLEIDDLITQAATNPLYRRIRSAVRIFAQDKLKTGTANEKAWAKDALVPDALLHRSDRVSRI